MHAHRSGRRTSIAIVGGETLLGKEVHELLEARKIPANIQLVASFDPDASTKAASILAIGKEEPIVMSSIESADLGSAQVVILAASKESGHQVYEKIRSAKPAPVVIDLTGALEDLAESRLRAPLVEPSGFNAQGPVQTIAHPAAIAIALLLTHLEKARPIRRSVIEIFEPVSERGKAGIEELQKQAVALLSFKPLPKTVFDAQVSFNLLSQYGSDAPLSLQEIELKIDRHLASLLAASGAPMPSLRLIQAPVFHGYSISVWLEFEENPGMDAIFQALGSSHVDVRTEDHEPPTNVGVAGQGGITVGTIAQDRNQPRAWWFWIAADNLQIAAENAGEVVREYLE
ncbi:MAG TPA: Asd/ArgC dimerization domain-containing protein [Bryobacteraceae bacterium]|nr:Asd/ArgC dimerization domain-containing protein [Bryobacteraceae bacterium]